MDMDKFKFIKPIEIYLLKYSTRMGKVHRARKRVERSINHGVLGNTS